MLEYRLAKAAQDAMNDLESGTKTMARNPDMVKLWKVLTELEDEDGK